MFLLLICFHFDFFSNDLHNFVQVDEVKFNFVAFCFYVKFSRFIQEELLGNS